MKKRSSFLLFSIIVLFTLGLVSASYAAGPKPIEWRFQDTYGAASWPCAHLNKPFIEWMQKASNGRIKISWHPPGAMASVKDTYDALSRGVFEMAALYPGFYIGTMPEGNAEQGLPWGWSDAKAHAVSLFKFGLFDIMKKVYQKHNIQLIAHYPMGDIYNIGTTKPVKTLADLKGMKIRAVGIYADYVRALGATPVSIPYGEMYMALKMGTIDGFLASSGSLVSNKLGEVVKYYLLPTTNSIGFVVAANKKAWDALPADLKTMLEVSAPLVAVGIASQYSGIVEHSIAVAEKKYGVKFTTLSPADQRKAIKLCLPIWERVGKATRQTQEAVDSIKKTLKYLGRSPE